MPKRRKNCSICEPLGKGISKLDDSCGPASALTRTEITAGFTFSTIDNPRDPSRGLFLRANQELAGLGGNNNFLRSTVDARLYQPLGYNSPIIAAFSTPPDRDCS